MGRRPKLKSDENKEVPILYIEILKCEHFFTVEKVLHLIGASQSARGKCFRVSYTTKAPCAWSEVDVTNSQAHAPECAWSRRSGLQDQCTYKCSWQARLRCEVVSAAINLLLVPQGRFAALNTWASDQHGFNRPSQRLARHRASRRQASGVMRPSGGSGSKLGVHLHRCGPHMLGLDRAASFRTPWRRREWGTRGRPPSSSRTISRAPINASCRPPQTRPSGLARA